jgi:hypothetical protein
MRRQLAATGRTALPGRLCRARPRHPISQLHCKAGTDIVMASCGTPRLSTLRRRLDSVGRALANLGSRSTLSSRSEDESYHRSVPVHARVPVAIGMAHIVGSRYRGFGRGGPMAKGPLQIDPGRSLGEEEALIAAIRTFGTARSVSWSIAGKLTGVSRKPHVRR